VAIERDVHRCLNPKKFGRPHYPQWMLFTLEQLKRFIEQLREAQDLFFALAPWYVAYAKEKWSVASIKAMREDLLFENETDIWADQRDLEHDFTKMKAKRDWKKKKDLEDDEEDEEEVEGKMAKAAVVVTPRRRPSPRQRRSRPRRAKAKRRPRRRQKASTSRCSSALPPPTHAMARDSLSLL
jgi:hypothetical protein